MTGRSVSPAARLLRLAEAMDQTLNAVYNLDPEDHATKSRDYGRGFAEALRVVRDEIDTRMALWSARDVIAADEQPQSKDRLRSGGGR